LSLIFNLTSCVHLGLRSRTSGGLTHAPYTSWVSSCFTGTDWSPFYYAGGYWIKQTCEIKILYYLKIWML